MGRGEETSKSKKGRKEERGERERAKEKGIERSRRGRVEGGASRSHKGLPSEVATCAEHVLYGTSGLTAVLVVSRVM